MNAVPLWIQILQALLTPTIALGVGLIAFLQWRTAHSKVVLDLFERRLEVYNRVMGIHRALVRDGVNMDMKTVVEFHQARYMAGFLFGDDLQAALKVLHEHVIDMAGAAEGMKTADNRQDYVKRAWESNKAAFATIDELAKMFQRYMKMDQRIVRAPSQWFDDRNPNRKGHAEKQ